MDEMAKKLLSAWNSHDTARVAALYAEDYQGEDIAEARWQTGPQAASVSFGHYLRAFPDIEFCAEQTVAAGEQTVLVWSARATHLGPVLNIPATGRRVLIRGVCLLTTRKGKIARALYLWDVAGLLREMMLLPEL